MKYADIRQGLDSLKLETVDSIRKILGGGELVLKEHPNMDYPTVQGENIESVDQYLINTEDPAYSHTLEEASIEDLVSILWILEGNDIANDWKLTTKPQAV